MEVIHSEEGIHPMMWLFVLICVVVLLAVGLDLFEKVYPPFGGKPSPEDMKRYRKSPNYKGTKFQYPLETKMFKPSPGTLITAIREYVQRKPQLKPERALPQVKLDRKTMEEFQEDTVVWFGHSSLFLQMGGVRLLVDPVFGDSTSPIGGSKRFSELPFSSLDELPPMDAIVLSHDHFDHLDYGTIRQLKDRVGRFIGPLGIRCHLERWGVAPGQIEECDWGEALELQGVRLACVPARHFSGRSLFKQGGGGLWCSWVIATSEKRVYFSGDSGYGPHFKEIGEKYGPFDLTLMECGQYDDRWWDIHMLPEQTARAHLDVRGNVLLPIHWGTFALAMHSWYDPVRRLTQEAKQRGIPLALPKIGEPVRIGGSDYPTEAWWKTVDSVQNVPGFRGARPSRTMK